MSVLTTLFFILLLISSVYGCLYNGILRANGQEWEIGNDIKYVKKCTIYEDGSWDVVNVGCLTPNGTRILANGEYFENSYVKKCTNVTGSWDLKNVACLTSNKTIIPNNVEWIEDNSFVKRCDVSTDGYVIVKTIECVTSDLRTIPANGEWKGDSYVNKCIKLPDGSLQIKKIACLSDDQRRIPVGGEWNGNFYVKKCTILSNGSFQIERIGCLTTDRKKMGADEEWKDGSYVKKCTISTNGTLQIENIECLRSDKKRMAVDEEWFEKTDFKKCAIATNGFVQIETMNASACLAAGQERIPVNGEWSGKSRFIKKCVLSDGAFYSKVVACLTNKKKERKEAGQEWMELDYVWKCSITDKKSLIYKSGCKTSEGKKIEIGDEMLIKNMYLEKCGYNEYTACMTPDKQRIPINGTWLEDSTVKKCDDIGHGALLIIDIGCVTPDETKISINGIFEDEKYQWNCINVGKGKVRLDKKIVKCEGGFSVGERWISNEFEKECTSYGVQQLVSCIHPVGVKIGVNETKVIEGKTIECIEFLNHTAVMRDQTTNLSETENNNA